MVQAVHLGGWWCAGLTVAAMEGNHPDGCYYYRLDWDGRSLVYALDCELEGDMASRVARFAQGADVLVWDTGFFPGELVRGWGHSTWEEGLTVGREAQVGQILMAHYGRKQSDLSVREQERLLEEILSCVMELARCDAGTLYLLDGDVLRFRISRNNTLKNYSNGEGMPPVLLDRANVCALALLEDRTICVEDVYHSPDYDFSGPGGMTLATATALVLCWWCPCAVGAGRSWVCSSSSTPWTGTGRCAPLPRIWSC